MYCKAGESDDAQSLSHERRRRQLSHSHSCRGVNECGLTIIAIQCSLVFDLLVLYRLGYQSAIQCLEVMQQESEDTDATLDALLSFLDECEPEEAADVDAQVPVQDTMRRASKRSRGFKPNRARDARRFELIHLRETVRSLESELEDLQARECSRQISAGSTHRTSDTSRSSASVPALVSVLSAWEGIASRQLEERQRAELENIRLKDFLAQQVKVAKALQKLIHKRTAWEVCGMAKTWCCVPSSIVTRLLVFVALSRS